MAQTSNVTSGKGLKIIGAGFGRTGTASLKAALETLGFGPCYHMDEVVQNAEMMIPLWEAVLDGTLTDWKTVSNSITIWSAKWLVGIRPDDWVSSPGHVRFRVAVVAEVGKPVAGAEVGTFWNAENDKMTPYKGAVSDRAGRFVLAVTFYGPGTQGLLALDKERKKGGLLLVESKSADKPVEIKLVPLVHVHGKFFWVGSPLSTMFPQVFAPNLGQQDMLLLVLYTASMFVTQKLTVTPSIDPAQAEQQNQRPEELLKQIGSRSHIGRLVTAEEIAYVATFLASPLAAGITGEVVPVTGGQGSSVYY